tara:strand:- start:55 stop:492 length:438 start_codon:yes stop_codon:yes gene_type:complete
MSYDIRNEKWTSDLTAYIEFDFRLGDFKEICDVRQEERKPNSKGEYSPIGLPQTSFSNQPSDNPAYYCSRVLSECLTRRFPDSSQIELENIYDTFSDDYRSTSVSEYTFNLEQSTRDIENEHSSFNRTILRNIFWGKREEEAYDE